MKQESSRGDQVTSTTSSVCDRRVLKATGVAFIMGTVLGRFGRDIVDASGSYAKFAGPALIVTALASSLAMSKLFGYQAKPGDSFSYEVGLFLPVAGFANGIAAGTLALANDIPALNFDSRGGLTTP